MESPANKKQIQVLTGRLTTLNRFISKYSDCLHPFFTTLRSASKNEWNEDCQKAFDGIKQYLTEPPILNQPLLGEELFMYLAVSQYVVSTVLLKVENGTQRPIYFVSKALVTSEAKYAQIEKMALALCVAAKKLRPYFQVHMVTVLTNQPIRAILHRPDISGRMMKWAVELGEFGIVYKNKTTLNLI